jgi:hypothetical protein
VLGLRLSLAKTLSDEAGQGGGSSERELSGPVTGDPLAREPNGSSPAAATQRALHRRSGPRYSIREYEESRLQAARRS